MRPTSVDSFRQLHAHGLLLLANAWDAGSARLIESLGAQAVATTSAGVAWSHGYPDSCVLPVPLLLATVADIARVIRIPLTVDIEDGYSRDPASVGETVVQLAALGVAGINLEDGTEAPDLLCAKIEHIKLACARNGLDVFVNARTDVYLRGLVPAGERTDETLLRAERYRAAGADGIFVPGLRDRANIRAIASALSLPLNVLALPDVPPAMELAALGVRRLSAGSGIAQSAFARTAALATAFLRDGSSDPLATDAMGYGDINALMPAR
ncbi:isocitrate lyase/phosphoenolpyruvate mutase family protein [Lysobacter sp. CFH 32150]|uniref:isocitrate lyase/PEP mutase family protein n=1 Tax=Lysobacter sp. CFH 32150 TaxID=2927128 RepID=UPI001FA70DF3|nr:isocitrate lyase/phosphoenolpyruvate mutase family protein [Lysobacter sp. CFH 32150]MCI4567918.1 isocitrate lyase/phosphoenolpyruvate mutase family protein [Lysobacter sp. CFH 32150]